jgi:hypothetical protein
MTSFRGQTGYYERDGDFSAGVDRFLGYNSTKTDRPRPPLLVGPHAALCKPAQGPAQLRLSLAQAAPL